MATRAKRIQTSEMYDSEYKIEKGVVYQRPIGKKTSDSWLVVDFPPYVSENDRKDFDAEMKNLFGAKYVAKKYEDGGEIGKYPFYVILDRFGMVKGFHSKKDAEEYIKHEVELVYEGMPNERKKERAEAKKDYSIVTRAEAKKYSGHIVDDIDGSTYAGGGEIEQQAIYEWNTMDRFVRADLLDEIDEDLNLGESRFEMKAYKYDDLPKNVQEEVVKRLGYDSSGSTYAEGGKIDQQIKFVITPKDKHDTVKGFFDEVYDNQEDYDWIHSFIGRDDGTAILKADKKSFDEAKKQKFFMFEEFEVSESKVYAEGGEIEREEMEEWFYNHDNEWQNDMEIDHQAENTDLDLVEWAYWRYHEKESSNYAEGGGLKGKRNVILKKFISKSSNYSPSNNKVLEDWEIDDKYARLRLTVNIDKISERQKIDLKDWAKEVKGAEFLDDSHNMEYWDFDGILELSEKSIISLNEVLNVEFDKKDYYFTYDLNDEGYAKSVSTYAEGGEIESVAKAIFEPNDFRGKIETTMGNKTLKGFENMIADNDAYDVYVALKPNFEGKGDGFIATTYGDKNMKGLIAMIENAKGGSTYAGGGGIMADGRLLLRSFNGVGGNNDKTYELIKDDRDSDGKPYYTLVENPSGKVMAQGDSFKEVNSVANLFIRISGSTYAGGGEIKKGDKVKVNGLAIHGKIKDVETVKFDNTKLYLVEVVDELSEYEKKTLKKKPKPTYTEWFKEKDLTVTTYAGGGGIKDVSGNYYSTNDFVSVNKLEKEAEKLFGKDWEAEDDVWQIQQLSDSIGGKYTVDVSSDSDEWEEWRYANQGLANDTNDSNYDIFVIPTSTYAEGGEINVGDWVKNKSGYEGMVLQDDDSKELFVRFANPKIDDLAVCDEVTLITKAKDLKKSEYAEGGEIEKELRKTFEAYSDEELQIYNGDNEETLKNWNRKDAIDEAVETAMEESTYAGGGEIKDQLVRVLKDSGFNHIKGKPLNEYTHNRGHIVAVVTKDSVHLSNYTPNTHRFLDSTSFDNPKKLAEYFDKNQIYAQGGSTYAGGGSVEKSGSLWHYAIMGNESTISRLEKLLQKDFDEVRKTDKFSKNKTDKELAKEYQEAREYVEGKRAENLHLMDNFGGKDEYKKWAKKYNEDKELPFEKGGSTYAKGGLAKGKKSNWFSGELSFLNW